MSSGRGLLVTLGSTRVLFFVTALLVVAVCGTWSPRPQGLSLLLIAVTMALLRTRRYGWLPPLFLLWANLHGAVVMGVWLLVVATAISFVEHPQSSRGLLAMTALSLGATLVTPLGITFWIDIARSLLRIRTLGIAEWAPPRLGDPALVAFWVMLVALVVLAAVRGRALYDRPTARWDGRLTLCGCALAFAPLALTA